MQFLQEAQLGFAGTHTAIGDAIGLSVKRLKERQTAFAQHNTPATDKKVIILLTDGANTAGEIEPLQAAELAAKINTTIYTIGIGSDEMLVRGFFGTRRVNPSADLDEKTLSRIAEMTGGQYFRARDTQELNRIYHQLDQLEPIEAEKEWLRPIKSLFMWPLGGALCLSLLMVLSLYLPVLYPMFATLLDKLTQVRNKGRENG
jgi:Ca-activated chloride channel family protein